MERKFKKGSAVTLRFTDAAGGVYDATVMRPGPTLLDKTWVVRINSVIEKPKFGADKKVGKDYMVSERFLA